MSPEFIASQFPEAYPKQGEQPSIQQKGPAAQLQHFLNQLGAERWELVESAQVGRFLMFFFKRPKQEPPTPKADVKGEAKPKAS